MISLLERHHVLDAWREVEPLIQRALDHSVGEFDKYDILKFILSEEMRLWVATDGPTLKGITVTQVIHFPRYRACQVVLMAGNDAFTSWFKDMMQAVEHWARSMGCVRIQEAGRPGWERMEKRLKLGFRKSYTVMYKDLGEN